MNRRVYQPGLTYYAMWLIVLVDVVLVVATLFGVFAMPRPEELILPIVVAVGGIVFLPTQWRRFWVLEEGLQVQDGHGTRLHRWEDLAPPRTRQVESIDHIDGGGSSQILAINGRRLYRIGPWFPGRQRLVRQILKRTRNN